MLVAIAAAVLTGTKILRPAKDTEVMVHDGKQVIVRHGPEATTASGNPAYVMVAGTKVDVEAEIERLGMSDADGTPRVDTDDIQDTTLIAPPPAG